MQRLICCNPAGIINATIMQFYGINVSEQRDISNLDPNTAYAIMQAIKCAVGCKYSKAKEDDVNQFIACIVQNILHIDPEIVLELTSEKPSLRIWQDVVDSIRTNLIKRYAGSQMTNDKIYEIVTDKLLAELESRFFR